MVELGKTFRSSFLYRIEGMIFFSFFSKLDNDKYSANCALKTGVGNRGGWWFNRCTRSNLNGLNYASGTASVDWTGIYWFKFGGSKKSMKTVTMSVIPRNHCKYLPKSGRGASASPPCSPHLVKGNFSYLEPFFAPQYPRYPKSW